MNLLILLFLIGCINVFPQQNIKKNLSEHISQKLRFSKLTIDNGLSQGLITSIIQDDRGFMWFGTGNGLDRFDGYNFKVFIHSNLDSNSISSNLVTSLLNDKKGRIWVETFSGGLNCFNPVNQTFFHFPFKGSKPNVVGNERVYTMLEDKKSDFTTIWASTTSNFLYEIVIIPDSIDIKKNCIINEFKNEKVSITPLPSDKKWLGSGYIVFHYSIFPSDSLKPLAPGVPKELTHKMNAGHKMVIDNGHHLWIGMSRGRVCRVHLKFKSIKNQSRLIVYPDTKTYKIFNLSNHDSQKSHHGAVILYLTKDGKVWGIWNNRITQLTDKSSHLIKFKEHLLFNNDLTISQKHSVKLSRPRSVYTFSGGNHDVSWIATNKGIIKFSPNADKINFYQHDPRDPGSLVSSDIRSIFVDRGGVVWCGSNGYGISYTNTIRKNFQHFDDGNNPNFSIYSLQESHDNKIWIQSKNKSIWKIFDFKTKRLLIPAINFKNYRALSLYEDKFNKVWFVSRGKLYIVTPDHPKNPRILYSLKKFSISDHQFVAADNKGNIWCVGPDMAFEFDAKTAHLKRKYIFKGLLPKDEAFRATISQLYNDSEGHLWISSDEGLFKLNLSSGKVVLFKSGTQDKIKLNTNNILSIHPDPINPKNILWLGTKGGGLNRLNISTGKVSYITKKDGLPSNVIYGILSDSSNSLWMSTNYGICRMKLAADTMGNGKIKTVVKEFDNYDKTDGLQGNEFNTSSYLKTKNGKLIFGGLHGFNIFNPESIKKNKHIPPVVITGLRVNHEQIEYKSKDSILTKPIYYTKSITLPYNLNTITVQFAALDYSSAQKNKFSYKLEGYEKQWSKPKNERSATYTQIPPGKYILHIRGSNNSGVWNMRGTSLQIIITPPFWRTWWAYTFYFLILAGIILLVIRSGKKRESLKYDAYQKNIEAEKFREVNRVKSNFFANISHELRTPLTLILGMIEKTIAQENLEAKKHDLNIALKYSKRLLKLINELLQLSKIDAGQEDFNPEPGNIVPIIKSLTSSFKSLANLKKIEVNFNANSENIIVDFDKDKIEKIINNLLSNAVKFTKPYGNITVSLEVETLKQINNVEQNELKLSVADSGIGIAREKLPFIFDRFYQVENKKSSADEGTGIGLALTSELVQLHHGVISAESIEGKGSTFIIRFPISKSEDNSPKNSEHEQLEKKPIVLDVESLNIYTENFEKNDAEKIENNFDEDKYNLLVVDDNADLRYYIKNSLDEGYNILEAGNGKIGFQIAKEQIPDLIITDVMMPELDGYKFTELIRKDKITSHIPVIMLTAKASDENKFYGLETGADAYLTKPFSSKELRIRVRKLIELRKKLQEQIKTQSLINNTSAEISSLDKVFLDNLNKEVEENIGNENYDIEKLALSLSMSSRQLRRKLKALTNQTPLQYIRSIKMKLAKELLEKGASNVTDTAFHVGYSNINTFSKAFKEEFGFTPSAIIRNSGE